MSTRVPIAKWLEDWANRLIESEDGADARSVWEWVRLAIGYVIVCFLGLYELARDEWKRWRR